MQRRFGSGERGERTKKCAAGPVVRNGRALPAPGGIALGRRGYLAEAFGALSVVPGSSGAAAFTTSLANLRWLVSSCSAKS
jgi:hypothetical protein